MAETSTKETLGFQTEVSQLLKLMVHSLYSNKEIFLRELISNGSDACDKLRFEALTDPGLFESDPDLQIRIEVDRDARTITISDNGIGMSRQEVIENIGTIAKSGTREFLDKLTGDAAADARLIGQFGVGFYSAFIVADKVTVISRRAGLGAEHGVKWESTGEGNYTIETVARESRGTAVILHLRDGEDDFLEGMRLRSIVHRYSDHINLPILMKKEEWDGDKGKMVVKDEEEQINQASALWARPKSEISDEQYQEFYKHVAHDFEPPLAWTHTKVEGRSEYTQLLYVPGRAPFDLWDRQQRHGVKLYVKRVFIMDDAEQLIPAWLRFVRGIVDSNDLPLNISREILQHNKTIESIRAGCTKKILNLLKDMAEKKTEQYRKFWQEFGRVLKEGIIDEPDKREGIAQLFRFSSTHDDREEQIVSLGDYVQRMQNNQKAIYYITAESFATARNSPHLEIFRKKGIEVLLLTDPIDEWVTAHLEKFADKPLQSVTKGDLDLCEQPDEKERKKDDSKFTELTKRIKKVLEEKVKEVRTTQRLTSSPACLVADDQEMGRYLEKILKASGQKVPVSKPVLEINADHPIIRKLDEEIDEDVFTEWSMILFEQSLLSEGGQLEDPAGFVMRLNKMFLRLGDKHPGDKKVSD